MLSLEKTAFVSTTADAGRFGIWPAVFGILTLLIMRVSPHSALINKIPSSPDGVNSTFSSPDTSFLLFSRRFFKSSFLHATVVKPNFHEATVSGSFK